jgi:hypothetical protein
MDRNDHPLKPHHLGVPSVLSKTIPEPMVRLAQTMHLSCSNTNTVSKWTETRFDMTHVIWELVLDALDENCFQMISQAYGTFGTNCAPILHRH